MFRFLVAMALVLMLVMAAAPTMARPVPPTPAPSTCEVTRDSIEWAADVAFVPSDARADNLTARLAACPGLRESLSADAQAWLDQYGI